jgi:signal transduction histidine kinase
MKLQMRFLLLFTIVFAAIAGLLVVQRAFDLQRTQHVLVSELHDRSKLFGTNLTAEGQTFQTFSEDYSFWDDMVSFVKNPNLGWAQTNLDSGLSTFGADVDWVYSPNGKMVYASTIDPSITVPTLPLPADFFSLVAAHKFEHFYLQLPNGTFEIRAATIVPGDDPEHKDPASGFWVIGRYLNSSFIQSMDTLSQTTVKLEPPTAPSADHIQGSTVSFTVPLKNINGQTVELISSTSHIALVDDLNSLYRRELTLISIVAILILSLILSSVWWLVLRPLRTLILGIQRQQPDLLDSMATSGSQFGELAIVVQQFYSQKLVIEQDTFRKAELERVNKDKSAFLAVAAHELKAPGAIIKLISEDIPRVAADNNIPPGILRQLAIIAHQANKMNVLVNDLRLASESGSAAGINESTVFDFDTFIQQEVTEIGYVIDQKITFVGDVHKTVKTDADHLSQVVSNLIRNGAKYSPHDTEIHVESRIEGGNIVVGFEDSGVGISPEDQTHVFERFYRAPSVANTYQGLGLGLSICQTIIERMGGKIWVESTLGQGSRFYFSLPLEKISTDLPVTK